MQPARAKCLKETRIGNFKRRSETKKSLVGASFDSVANENIAGLNGEVENPMLRIMKRKKLVRPVFGKMEPATDAMNTNTDQSKQLTGQILNKDDGNKCEGVVGMCEAKTPNDNAMLSNVTAPQNLQPMGCNRKEHSNCEEQKNLSDHVLSSTSHEQQGHKTSNVGKNDIESLNWPRIPSSGGRDE